LYFGFLSTYLSKPELPYTHLEELEIGDSTLKKYQMFSVYITPGEFKNTTITGDFGFVRGKPG